MRIDYNNKILTNTILISNRFPSNKRLTECEKKNPQIFFCFNKNKKSPKLFLSFKFFLLIQLELPLIELLFAQVCVCDNTPGN